MVDDDSDEMLGARLDSALRTRLDLDQVDVGTLLQGSRRRARRVRTQRIAAVAAASVLVVALPVGYEVINPAGRGSAPPAALLPSSSRPPVTHPAGPINQPNPTAVPSPVPPSGTGFASATTVPTSIPETFVSIPGDELPAGVSFDRTVPNTGQVQVAGQQCGRLASDQPQQVRPVDGRQWMWSAGSAKADVLSISLTVTSWAEGESATAFKQAVAGTGNCRWTDPQKPRAPSPPGSLGSQSWGSTSSSGDRHYARTLVRIGNGIIGIEVTDPAGSGPAADLADRLMRLQVARMTRG
jgi:hypothetical protein